MLLIFTTKARTLASLQSVVKLAEIKPLFYFTVNDWKVNKNQCKNSIKLKLGNGPWIIRSSSLIEDSTISSKAGEFLSIQNVENIDLEKAVDKVISSYGDANPDNEVLVQPMLLGVIRSGVVFSHDPNTCSPYRVVNWSQCNDTTFVTGGMGGRVWQQAAESSVSPPTFIKPIIDLLNELLNLFEEKPIDFEFAVTKEAQEEKVWLLQVRPLILKEKPETAKNQSDRLILIENKIKKALVSHPFLLGKSTVYSVMTDWNPAEILGIRPMPLALSLYRELVTDSIWAYQRHNYGYRNLRSFPLMSDFIGIPYVDVRLSFNSFIPADLDSEIARRLVDHYIDCLLQEPTLHDKIEFDIVFSCYTFDLPKRIKRLQEKGFTCQECNFISSSLRKLTNQILHPKEGLWRQDAEKINILKNRRKIVLESDLSPVEKIYWLLEDAKRYGTLPFAGLARAAFVSVQMLKSMVEEKIISNTEYDTFFAGISTVSGQLVRDRSTISKEKFLLKYGHLRPGTYNILSPRYDEEPETYFDWDKTAVSVTSETKYQLPPEKMKIIGKLLNDHKLHSNPDSFFNFLKSSIEMRESAKFYFTHNLSDILSLISEIGSNLGISREELAFCDIMVFKELYLTSDDIKSRLINSIEQGKLRYAETKKLSLNPIIAKPEDVWAFEWPETAPNFITQKQVTALTTDSKNKDYLENSIVFIPNADPGYDWLFSYPIAGLVTVWGGVNSHMAIRAGEIGLPAVIGAGEILYQTWSKAERIHIDCAGRRVEIIS